MLARVMLARAVVAWLCLFDVGDGDEGMLLASVVEANGQKIVGVVAQVGERWGMKTSVMALTNKDEANAVAWVMM